MTDVYPPGCGGAIAIVVVQTNIHTMPYHHFKVGQIVVAPSAGPHALIPRGPHVIVRLLPVTDDEPQYRIRSEADGQERVVTKRQIRLADPGP